MTRRKTVVPPMPKGLVQILGWVLVYHTAKFVLLVMILVMAIGLLTASAKIYQDAKGNWRWGFEKKAIDISDKSIKFKTKEDKK